MKLLRAMGSLQRRRFYRHPAQQNAVSMLLARKLRPAQMQPGQFHTKRERDGRVWGNNVMWRVRLCCEKLQLEWERMQHGLTLRMLLKVGMSLVMPLLILLLPNLDKNMQSELVSAQLQRAGSC